MSSANYTYSYSGSDCDAFAFFPGSDGLREGIEAIAVENAAANQTKVAGWTLFQNTTRHYLGGQNPFGRVPKLDPTYDTSKEVANPNFFTPVHLTQMATISISIHEAKSPVRRIGERGVSGYTRGIRTIAGTIVFLVIEDHPLRMLAAKDPANIYNNLIGWSRDLETKGVGSGYGEIRFDNKISTLISPVNIMLRYQTEVARNGVADAGASMMLEGVEFVNEGIVTSVNDMVTEVVCQFVAQDVRPFTDLNKQTSQEIINAYNAHKGKDLYEPYYRQLINSHKSQQPAAQPNQFGTTSVEIDGYER
jgi:hypothetical protein